MSYGNDPLEKYGRPLAGVLIAVVISILIAAMIGGSVPFEYETRAWVYTLLVVYLLVGGVVVFRMVADSEQGPLTPVRVLKWTASLWVWPLFLLSRR
jgi:general stress protein CsbA